MESINEKIDTIELELESQLINAQYQYLKYLRQKHIPKFMAETIDFVWDDTHWYYKYLFPTKKSDIESSNDKSFDNKSINPAQKKLYKKLCLICHPDKCDKSWASDMILIITTANQKNDLHTLQKIYDYYKINQSFDLFYESDFDFNKKQLIKQWQSEYWYLWLTDPIIKEIFISQSKYETNLKKQNEQLQKEHSELQKENEQLQKEHSELQREIDELQKKTNKYEKNKTT
jgi:hypothetical protein